MPMQLKMVGDYTFLLGLPLTSSQLGRTFMRVRIFSCCWGFIWLETLFFG